MKSLIWWILFVFPSILLIPIVTEAKTPNAEADRLYNEGHDLHKEGEFEEALTRYRAAYTLDPAPDIWANIVFCLKDLGQDVAVIGEYDAHIAEHWSKLSQLSRNLLESYLLGIGEVLGFGLLVIDTRVPGTLTLDGKRLSDLAPGIPLRIPAGKHVIRLEAPNMAPVEQTVEVRSGKRGTTTLSPRKPWYIDIRVGFTGGGTTTHEELNMTERCSVYCFPGINVLVGGRLTIPMTGPFVAEIGGDYMYTRSIVATSWPRPMKPPAMLESRFSIHAAMVHAGAGMDVIRGPFRLQWRLGVGLVLGQHKEQGISSFETTLDEHAQNLALADVHHMVVRTRVGLSVRYRRIWFGIGVEGVGTLVAFMPTDEVPRVSAADIGLFRLVGPGNIEKRPLGHLLVISPEVNVGFSF